MKKKLFVAIAIAHLTLILYNNIQIEREIMCKVLNIKVEKKEVLTIKEPKILEKIAGTYSAYAGINTGYGFYAPNVSSPVVLMLTRQDRYGNTLTIGPPAFSSKDATVRYYTALNIFLNKIDNRDINYNKYLNVLLKSIALWTINSDVRAKKVNADLLIYNLPLPQHKIKNYNPTYIKIGHYEFTNKEYYANK